MNLNHLKAFVKVVQTKSYQDAAKLLNVSQPAITLRIKSLEEHFKTKLFKRGSEGVSLTSQGERIYKESLTILEKWELLELSFIGDQPKGKLTIGASTIPSEYLLPTVLKSFCTKYSDISFNVKVSGTEEVIDWLMNRNVDLIITGKPKSDNGIESIPIYHDQLKFIFPPETLENDMKIAELLDWNWIVREKNSNTRAVWEEALKASGYRFSDLKIVGEMGSTEAVIAAVEAGLGVSVVSSLASIRAANYGRVKVLDVKDVTINRPFYLSYLAENRNSATIKAFLNEVSVTSLTD